MTALTTGNIYVPDQILDPWLGKVRNGSTIAALSSPEPMKFGAGQSFTFDIGEAEYVGEGANKGPTTIVPTVKTVKPFKFHKTVRWTEEVMWADEDHQLGVVAQILDLIQPALSRALDLGVFHGVNPATGNAVVAMTESLSDTTNQVEYGSAAPYSYLDSAAALVMADGYNPRDAALDPSYAARFRTLRTTDGLRIYPDFNISTQVSTLDGHRASTSNTVSGQGVITGGSGVSGFVGDFDGIRWGIQRQIGLEVIRYGDPDGNGDLKRNNQVAFRSEVVYGWGIADLDAFAQIVDEIESGS